MSTEGHSSFDLISSRGFYKLLQFTRLLNFFIYRGTYKEKGVYFIYCPTNVWHSWCKWCFRSLNIFQIIWRTFQKSQRITKTRKVWQSSVVIIIFDMCGKKFIRFLVHFGVLHVAALSIVKEVANHANDIMKQGVRISFPNKMIFVSSLSSPSSPWCCASG